jgi:NNP family nitrate/nitrite transporter-like MFS transporter
MEPFEEDKACPIPEPLRNLLGTLLFVSGLFFLSFLARMIFAPLMPSLERELGLTHAEAGSLFLMISIGFFVAQVNSGFVSSKFNHKGALAASAVGVGGALLVFPFVHSLTGIRLTLTVLGFAAGLHVPSALATITAMVSRQDWGKALGIHQTSPNVALVLAPLLVQALAAWLSWRGMVAWLGVISLGVAVAFVFAGRCGDFKGKPPEPTMVKRVGREPSVWLMMYLFAMAIAGSLGLYTMLPLFLVSEKGYDPGWANTLLGLSRISGLFVVFIAGWATDRLGESRAISAVLFASGVATVLLGYTTGTFLTVMIFLQPALAACFFAPGFSALSRIVPPSLRSLTASLVTPCGFLVGGGMFPAFLGYMGQRVSFAAGLLVLGLLMLSAPLAAWFLKFRHEEEKGC